MPKYDVTVKQENMMDGVEVEVPYLGIVENGTTRRVELETSEAKHLRTAYGVEVKSVDTAKKAE